MDGQVRQRELEQAEQTVDDVIDGHQTSEIFELHGRVRLRETGKEAVREVGDVQRRAGELGTYTEELAENAVDVNR